MESECFGEKAASDNLEGKAFLQVYKSVLNSKATEETLVSFLLDDTLYDECTSYDERLHKNRLYMQQFRNVIIPKIAVQFC